MIIKEDSREKLYEKAKLLPLCPGVYIMKNASGKVIYVGKSKSLRNRVTSYFAPYSKLSDKTEKLVTVAKDFECYYTPTELDALVLESKFIKQHMPKYNIKLKDARDYPYIRVSSGDYPDMIVVHRKTDDKSTYYGPFSSSSFAWDVVSTARKIFMIHSCKKTFPKDIGCRPCLFYHINQCVAPCTGKVTPVEYKAIFERASRFLKGDYKNLSTELEKLMDEAAEDMRFEAAAKYRDCITAVKKIGEKQIVVSDEDADEDIVGIYNDDLGSAIVVLFVRRGIIYDRDSYFFGADEIIDSNAITGLLQRFYELRQYIPKKVIVSSVLEDEDAQILAEQLSAIANRKVTVYVPQRGVKATLAVTAADNARELLFLERAKQEKGNKLLAEIAAYLQLDSIPERIEAYDISNSSSSHTTAGMIVSENGVFAKKKYRTFSIKHTSSDDYGAMKEALSRRFARKDETSWELPDLILLDGGVGHITVAKQALSEAGLVLPVFGMVKDEFHKTRTLTDGENEISIAHRNDIYTFIYKIQEEVHRFALSRMDNSRRKTVRKSILENVSGIGSEKAKKLNAAFGGLRGLKKASVEEITAVKGISQSDAKAVFEYLANINKKA